MYFSNVSLKKNSTEPTVTYKRKIPRFQRCILCTTRVADLIVVNDEYGNIRAVLPKAMDILAKGGRLAVITFHSGEDRIVKNFFREMSASDYPRIKLVNKKPIIAGTAELERNPRARSAKLRVAEKL
jgi:16S rRNA C1402 N4-methylase RsmH